MMPDLDAIASLERTAAHLGNLLEDWSRDRENAVLEFLAIDADDPHRKSPTPPIEILSLAIDILHRLTAIQKTLASIRITLSAPTPGSEFRFGVQTSVSPDPAPPSSLAEPPVSPAPASIPSISPSPNSLAQSPRPMCPIRPIGPIRPIPQSNQFTLFSPFSQSTPSTRSTSPTLPLSASADTSLHPASAGVPAFVKNTPAGLSRLSSTRLQPSDCLIPSIPSVRCVRAIPLIRSIFFSGPIDSHQPTAAAFTPDFPLQLYSDFPTTHPDCPEPPKIRDIAGATHALTAAIRHPYPRPPT